MYAYFEFSFAHVSGKKMINKTILGDQLYTSFPTSKLEIAFNQQKCKII